VALLVAAASAVMRTAPTVASADPTVQWPGFQGGPSHPGLGGAQAAGVPLRLSEVRLRRRGQGRLSGVVIIDGQGVTASRTGFLGFDPATGVVAWSVARDHGNVLSPAADPASDSVLATEGTVRRGSALVALDPSSGRALWRRALPQPATSAVTVAGGQAVFGMRGNRVGAVDVASHVVRWTVAVGGVIDSAPAVDGGRGFVTSSSTATARSRLSAIDMASGHLAWSHQATGFTSLVSAPSVVRGRVYAAFGDATLRAFDATSGRRLWSSPLREAASPFSAPAVDATTVYVNDRLGGLYALDARTGARRWDYQFDSTTLWGAPLLVGGVVYLGLDDGAIAAVSARSGRLVWSTRLRFGAIGSFGASGAQLIAPLLGGGGGIALFRHDPTGTLVDVGSPTTLILPRALFHYALSVAILAVLILAFFRIVLDPQRLAADAAGRRAVRPHRGEPRVEDT
jgi:outer membrane protein assembly factor BamB